jgi:hypothetical protein
MKIYKNLNKNQFSESIQKGEWWKLGSWEDKEILSFLPFSNSEVNEALEELKKIFPPSWFLKNIGNKRPHPLVSFFRMGGIYPLEFLVWLGLYLKNIEKIKNGKRLIKAIKSDKENFNSLLDEIKWGSWLIKRGYYQIEKLEEGPDFKINLDNLAIYLEIKRLEETQFEKFVTDFIMSFLTKEITLSGFDVEIEVTENCERALKFAFNLSSEEERKKFFQECFASSLLQFKKEIEEGNLNGETFYFKYVAKKSETASSGIRYSFLDKPLEIRIRSKIDEALKQSKQINAPLVIAIDYSYYYLDEAAKISLETYAKIKNQPLILFRSFMNRPVVEKIVMYPNEISSPKLKKFLDNI